MLSGSRIAIVGLAVAASALVAPLALAQQGQNRMTGLKLAGDQPIQIESDTLEVRENEGVAVFTGNVNVVQGETLMKSGSMVVHYANSGGGASAGTASAVPSTSSANIERIEVSDKVYVKSRTQEATADKATFDMASQLLVMTGKEVVLTDSGNVVVGCKLTVQMASGQAKLDGCGGGGRVKMLLQPGSQSQ